MREFFWFCVSGTLAFGVDAGVLELILLLPDADPYTARIVSFLCAVTTTWLFNRSITFRGGSGLPLDREWMLYLSTQLVGFAFNYGTYALLVYFVELVREHTVLGVAAGSIAGLLVNFTSARRVVFRQREPL